MIRKLCILIITLIFLIACDSFDFGPYNVLPGDYVRNLGDGYTDLAITFNEDGTCHVTQFNVGFTDPIVDLDTEYTYSYSSFSFDLAVGTVNIADFGEFQFRWYSSRKAFQYMELINRSAGTVYTMVYGTVM